MKAALICPVPDLERYVGSTTVHLLLPYLFGPAYDVLYQDYYAMRRREGDYLILDNGAYLTDGGEAVSMSRLLEITQLVRAQEVVLPDVIRSADSTIARSRAALDWLNTVEGRNAYQSAGRPRLMIVPQGVKFSAWSECLERLLSMVSDTMERVGGPEPAIGVSKVYGPGILNRLEALDVRGHLNIFPIHLLGWAGSWDTLEHASELWGEKIRSVDSARPITYGKLGRRLNDGEPHVSRDADFFNDSVPLDRSRDVIANIDLFRSLVGDTR